MPERPTSAATHLFPWGIAGLIGVLVLVCYWPALHGGLVWDDQAHVTAPELRSWAGLWRIWSELGATQQYYPILHSAFWIENRLWGDATLGYHLINATQHAIACVLLALALRRLGETDLTGAGAPVRVMPAGAGWLAALIFAVHPVCVESVAWISEQKNTLSLIFYLAAAYLYLDFKSAGRRRSYWLATAVFLLALGTKSVTATLPAALLVLTWWRNGKLAWRRDVLPLLPWFCVAVVAGLFTAWVERKFIGAEGAAFDLSAVQRIFLAARILWFYVGKLFWPADLMFIYPHWDVAADWTGWFGGLLAAVAVTVGFWLIRARDRGPLASWLFFVGSLFPALGFVNVYPFIFSYVADHFQYLASLGIMAGVAGSIAGYLAVATRSVRIAGWIACGLLVTGLAVLTNRQSRQYVDGETLYRATLAQNPNCWMAHNNLAVELAKSPATEADAIAHYEAALRIKPDYAEAHNNLATELTKIPGRESEAIAHCERALQLHPDYAEAHCNLANVLATLPGRMPEAISHYEQALHFKPDLAEIHYSFANTLAKLPGRMPEALAQYEAALRLMPDHIQTHVNLANELAKLPGRLPDALRHYERALQIDPDLAEVHYNLAVQLSRMPDRGAEVLAHYQEALRLQPKYAKAHNNIAILYAQKGQLEEARKHWEKALELNPDYEDARRNLEQLRRLQQK